MTTKEKFYELAQKRAEESKGTPYEWNYDECADNLYNFATQHKWWNEDETMWDDIIDEWEDMPTY